MNKHFFLIIIVCSFVLFSMGCSNKQGPTISPNMESEYTTTFQALNIGTLFDFEFYSPTVDENWVTIWVERYVDGVKDPLPITEISFSNGHYEIGKGPLGFGIINPNAEESFVFLYGPSVSTQPSKIENLFKKDFPSAWGYAISDKKIKIELEETMLLAVYRQSGQKNFMRAVDLQDESDLEKMINEDSTVLLLKIRIGTEPGAAASGV